MLNNEAPAKGATDKGVTEVLERFYAIVFINLNKPVSEQVDYHIYLKQAEAEIMAMVPDVQPEIREILNKNLSLMEYEKKPVIMGVIESAHKIQSLIKQRLAVPASRQEGKE